MEMNIVYSADDKYVRHIFVSMMSLLESQKMHEHLNLYLVDNEISKGNKEILDDLAGRYGRSIHYLPFQEIADALDGVMPWGGSLSAYARLFLARYIPADKVLYMDGDSVIQQDLQHLFELDISEYYFAAVQDTAGPEYRKQVGIEDDEQYVNSGLTLINLKKWREDSLEDKFLAFIRAFDGNVPCCDQGVLNGVCKGKILILPPKYNVMTPMLTFKAEEIQKLFEIPQYYSEEELCEARERPVFVHFVGGFFSRPWFEGADHPKKHLYQKYMEQSPWKGIYLPKEHLGKRTLAMRWAYRHLPFSIFMAAHRTVRWAKRTVSRMRT